MLSQTLQYLGIAFISSIVLLLMSWLMQTVLRRPADYYSAEEIQLEEPLYGTIWHAVPGAAKKSEEDLDQIRKMLEQAYAEQTVQEQPEEPAEEPTEEPVVEEPAAIPAEEPLEEPTADQPAVSEPETSEEPAPATPAPEPEEIPAEEPAAEPAAAVVSEPSAPAKKSGRPRKPSMKMKKAELIEIAENMGIEIPEKATKQIILDLIREHQ